MKKSQVFLFLLLSLCLLLTCAAAETYTGYIPLDVEDPVMFYGDRVVYDGETITLGPKALYIDGTLSDEVVAQYPYVYNTLNDAMANLTNGTAEEPMQLLIAPYVYWIDDPDDPEVRTANTPYHDTVPFGITAECEYLSFIGLNSDSKNVVIAANRGQTQGAIGNYTLFYLVGDGLTCKNVTFGNYCNVDLVYPLKPELSREKRSAAITQAQLIMWEGDMAYADNCRFISRLNLRPIGSSQERILYTNCHFTSTDDALSAVGVHVNCTFEFYGTMPLASANGAAFLNCTFYSRILGIEADPNQYMSKMGGLLTIVDGTFVSNYDREVNIAWTKVPDADLRNFYSNVTHNGTPIDMSPYYPWVSVNMDGTSLLNAFKLTADDGSTMYNVYNLLRGENDWDPLNMKDQVLALSQRDGVDYANIPTVMNVDTDVNAIESGVSTATLTYTLLRFNEKPFDGDAQVTWFVSEEQADLVSLSVDENGVCTVIGTNDTEESVNVTVYAGDANGLIGCAVISVAPSYLEAPAFITEPTITAPADGKVSVNYVLDLGERADQSLITWYRCTDAQGANAIPVAVSRLNDPLYTYTLTEADAGYYLMVKVEPKHLRCFPGEGKTAVAAEPISIDAVTATTKLSTNFVNFPADYQPEILPGFWTLDGYKPADTSEFEWSTTNNSWTYLTEGRDGSLGYMGLSQTAQGARMRYTPVAGEYGDMSAVLVVAPNKTVGQGFGSAKQQYMDVMVKYDTETLTGYGVRIIRTSKYSNACDFILIAHENGQSRELSEPVSASALMTECTISVKVVGDQLTAHVETTSPQLGDQASLGLAHSVDLTATIEPSTNGGFAVQHTGTTGGNSIMFLSLDVEWQK